MNLLRTLGVAAEPSVLVTLAAVTGTAPRRPGAHMLVTADRVQGSVGGGDLEREAVTLARTMIAGQTPAPCTWSGPMPGDSPPAAGAVTECVSGLLHYEFLSDGVGAWAPLLDGAEDQTWVAVAGTNEPFLRAFVGELDSCGLDRTTPSGRWLIEESMRLIADPDAPTQIVRAPSESGGGNYLLDIIRPPGFLVTVFGAGHVGRAIVHILANIPAEVTWIDDRAEMMPDAVADNVVCRVTQSPDSEVEAVPSGSYCVVTTHSHELDRAVCERLLRRDDLRFVGLIGSRRKRAGFEERWRAEGMAAARISRLVSPVGLPGVGGRSPGEIAVAVVAQILRLRDSAG